MSRRLVSLKVGGTNLRGRGSGTRVLFQVSGTGRTEVTGTPGRRKGSETRTRGKKSDRRKGKDLTRFCRRGSGYEYHKGDDLFREVTEET